MSTHTAAPRLRRTPKPMNSWRLEWLRMTRTPRAIALAGTYLFLGLLGPVTARYLQDIVNRFQSGVQVIFAHPTPKDGIANYISQISQTGLVVVIVITAGALTFDARRGLSTFLRTRTTSMWQLIAPRFTVNAAAAVAAYALGTLAAWYETALLLGSPPPGAMLAGLLCGSVYLVFAVSVATAAASLARSTLGTVGVALGILLALPLLGMAGPLHAWLPSTLVTAPIALLDSSTLGSYLPALAISAISTPLLLAAATFQLKRRDV